MRVPSSNQYSLMREAIARNRLGMAAAQAEIASGRRVNDLSTDPTSAGIILRANSLLRAVDGYRRSGGEAGDILSQTAATLDGVNNDLQQVYELTVQLGNDSYNASDRAEAANQIAGLKDQLIASANQKVGERYIFGGLANAGQPFDAAGAFAGDTGKLTVPVGQGVTVDATLPGGSPFTDPSGGPSVFAVLDTLQAALLTDDGAGIRASIDPLKAALDRVAASQQESGHALARLDGANAALDRVEDATKAMQKSVGDTDYADAVIRLKQAEEGLQASLAVTSQLGGLNLASILGR